MSTVGTKNYNGQDWFWPHDYRHYLRDANARQRKKIHDAWLKIGVPVKKSGLKISDSYLEPKKNQLKKAWMIVRKVVAPKELGQPIPESVNEANLKKLEKIGDELHTLISMTDVPDYKNVVDDFLTTSATFEMFPEKQYLDKAKKLLPKVISFIQKQGVKLIKNGEKKPQEVL